MEVSDQLHHHYPLDRRLGGTDSWFGCCGEKKSPYSSWELNSESVAYLL